MIMFDLKKPKLLIASAACLVGLLSLTRSSMPDRLPHRRARVVTLPHDLTNVALFKDVLAAMTADGSASRTVAGVNRTEGWRVYKACKHQYDAVDKHLADHRDLLVLGARAPRDAELDRLVKDCEACGGKDMNDVCKLNVKRVLKELNPSLNKHLMQ